MSLGLEWRIWILILMMSSIVTWVDILRGHRGSFIMGDRMAMFWCIVWWGSVEVLLLWWLISCRLIRLVSKRHSRWSRIKGVLCSLIKGLSGNWMNWKSIFRYNLVKSVVFRVRIIVWVVFMIPMISKSCRNISNIKKKNKRI